MSSTRLQCWLVITIATALATVTASTVVVETSMGKVQGTKTPTAQVFRGIPYAAPPVGNLRWKPPQPAPAWAPKVLDATGPGVGCPQVHCTDLTPSFACPDPSMLTEDCLQLAIYTPLSTSNTSSLPVMMWIHGGNFFYGAGSSPLYDGSVLASRGNVLVVDINYRIGALGFLVTGKGPDDATGNYALMDQRLAMQWIHKHIRAFGGDPDKVTLFGQSAGAQSSLQHIMSKVSSTYFRSAILESVPSGLPYKSFDEAFVLGGLFAKEVGCSTSDMTCMRSKSSQEVAEAAFRTRAGIASLKLLESFEPYGPFIDGVEVTGQPVDVFTSGQFLPKPLMLGSLTEETVIFIYGAYNKTISFQECMALLAAVKPSQVATIAGMYKLAAGGDQRETLVKVATDLVFTCPTRNTSRANTGRGLDINTWMYVFDHAFSFPGWGNDTFCYGRVCHGGELPYVFSTADKANFTFTPEEVTMSQHIMDYWANFAWNGDPNTPHPGGQHTSPAPPQWPQFGSHFDPALMYIQTPLSVSKTSYHSQQCDMWDRIGYY